MFDGLKIVRDLAVLLGRSVPAEQWPRLMYRSPVLRHVLLSKETMSLIRDMGIHSKAFRDRLAQALFEQKLITAEEVRTMGIIPLGQRLAEHLNTLGPEAPTEERP